jgi:hypothetical protein
MSVFDRTPGTMNFLSPLGFRFILSRSPEINYFVQSVTLPELSIGSAEVATPFNRIRFPGDKATYSDLQVTFKVDEKMINFIHIYDWITNLAKQNNFAGYKSLADAGVGAQTGIFSDATLVVMTSSYNVNKQVVFTNIYPTDLTGLTFDSTASDVNYLQATVTFAIQKYEIING